MAEEKTSNKENEENKESKKADEIKKDIVNKSSHTSNERKTEKLTDKGEVKSVDVDANMAAMIYSKLNKVFGASSQLFTMEFPGRTLNQMDYAYPIEDYNSSSLSKPYVIAENEFRLCDDMFDLSPIVSGPCGSKVSNVYNTVLNNYTPRLDDVKDFIIDKMELRLFLMQKITDELDGETLTCSRLEFCQRLYKKYLENKYKWDQEKIEKQKLYTAQKELDEYAKWLSTTAWTKDQELESLFNDAIIRGFYHEIMTILGFIDISSPSERLSNAKANRRSSVRRSYDGGMDILPVRLQPSNWFRSLTPNFSPKDLTLGSDFLKEQYKAKSDLLSSLEAELRILISKNVDEATVSSLQAKAEELKKNMVDEEKTYFAGYTSAQIDMVKKAFEIASKGDIVAFISGGEVNVLKALENLDKNKFDELLGLTKDALETLIKDMNKLYSAHLDYFTTYNQLVDAELAISSAKTSNYQDQIEILKERIKLVSKEVSDLSTILTSDGVNTTDKQAIFNDTELLPSSKYDEDTEFSDIVISTEEMRNMSDSEKSSSYGKLAGSFGCLFFNSSASSDISSSSSNFVKSLYSSDCTIGMRVAKVTIDRSGWFDPGIIDLSSSFMRLSEKTFSGAGLTASQIINAYNDTSNQYATGNFSEITKIVHGENGDSYIFPAFPIAFLIAKDIVIKAKMSDFNEEDFQKFQKMTTSTSTSIFGISVSGAVNKESYMDHSDSSSGEVTFYMRIPGPQILGWFVELTSKDMSLKYESLSKAEYFKEIMESLKDYREKLSELDSESLGKGFLEKSWTYSSEEE